MRFQVIRFQRLEAIGNRREVGAGDLVARLAKPIARRLDKFLGTNLAECESCERRRRWLNRI